MNVKHANISDNKQKGKREKQTEKERRKENEQKFEKLADNVIISIIILYNSSSQSTNLVFQERLNVP